MESGSKRTSIEMVYEPDATTGAMFGWRNPPRSGKDHPCTVGGDGHAVAEVCCVGYILAVVALLAARRRGV